MITSSPQNVFISVALSGWSLMKQTGKLPGVQIWKRIKILSASTLDNALKKKVKPFILSGLS